jgi:predicted phage terminase large subunit-like protein
MLTDMERKILAPTLRDNHLLFTRYMFKQTDGSSFRVSEHHRVMSEALDAVMAGRITRLIINIPPGYTKTLMAVVMFISRGLAINPRAKFIHLSYSDSLAMLNSTLIRDVVLSQSYQELFPMQMHNDRNSKKAWYNTEGGGLYATSTAGQVTGFRAGRADDHHFTGAMIIDDPIKPEDAYSEVIRNRINMRFTNTLKSRLMKEDVPIIVIMQRVHEDDQSAFLLNGGSGETWQHLNIPVLIDPEADTTNYSHGEPLDHGLAPGPLWPYKHSAAELDVLRKADPYTYSSQYEQRPSPLGGGIFKQEWWQYYDQLPDNISVMRIYADTAQKTGEHNDYSVFQCWAYCCGNAYLVDQIRGKWEAPDLESNAIRFWHLHRHIHDPLDPHAPPGVSSIVIEDKSSGSSLIQQLRQVHALPVTPLVRDKDKIFRAMGATGYISSGRVHLPRNAHWLDSYLHEFGLFTPLMTHKWDDQIDPTMDAIEDLLATNALTYSDWV